MAIHPLCQRCRRKPSYDLHHLAPRSVAPQLVLAEDNLVVLCRGCHNWVKDNPRAAYESGWLRKS